MVEIKKDGKGYEVTLNGEFIQWTIGSKANALKELKKDDPAVYNYYIKHNYEQ